MSYSDVTFYFIALALLVVFFQSESVTWYEALLLFAVYVAYCVFMKYNTKIEKWFKVTILGQQPKIVELPRNLTMQMKVLLHSEFVENENNCIIDCRSGVSKTASHKQSTKHIGKATTQ